MTLRKRFLFGLGGLLVLGCAAVVGYAVLMNWSLGQAVFFTLITITGIGYSDYDLNDPAKLLTIALIVAGIFLFYLVLSSGIEYAAVSWELRRRRRMERDVERLHDHFIVVGCGAVGHDVVHRLRQAGRIALVVDLDPAVIEMARAEGVPALHGDATEEETLLKAGIQRAAGLLAVTRSDPINVFVTLTARGLRPDLYIAANATGAKVKEKLRRAGAAVVISPYEIGAQRLAMAAVSPHAAEMLAGYSDADPESGLTLRETEVEEGSPACGKALRESGLRERTGLSVAAVKVAETGELVLNPGAAQVLQRGDIVVALGLSSQMQAFVAYLSPQAAKELRWVE